MVTMSGKQRSHLQSGAVSLFVVMFAMLIISVMTISFLRIMVTDQNQASDNDLSQSAYDSAQAGVEDAKRALLYYQKVCSTDGAAACAALADELATSVCNKGVLTAGVVDASSVVGGTAENPGEIMVQQSSMSNDADLNQAYTCLKMQLTTGDYIGELAAGESRLVPLVPEDGQTFDTVTVKWFSSDDLSDPSAALDLTTAASGSPLMIKTSWPADRPSVMRTQLIQLGGSFTLDGFDATGGTSGAPQSNANTVFLYPVRGGTSAPIVNTETLTDRDIRKTSAPGSTPLPSAPVQTRCSTSVSGGGYACQMSLSIPAPLGGGSPRAAYLRLMPYYNATHFQVILSQGGPVDSSSSNLRKFKDVQPEIDSTGRANDLFRRVISRVDLYDTSFPYPDATLDVTGNLCKDFGVTSNTYIAGSCTP